MTIGNKTAEPIRHSADRLTRDLMDRARDLERTGDADAIDAAREFRSIALRLGKTRGNA
ncbi:MAG: hypothetical protein ACK4NR_09295 [Micavibrio sp.]